MNTWAIGDKQKSEIPNPKSETAPLPFFSDFGFRISDFDRYRILTVTIPGLLSLPWEPAPCPRYPIDKTHLGNECATPLRRRSAWLPPTCHPGRLLRERAHRRSRKGRSPASCRHGRPSHRKAWRPRLTP